MGEPEFKTNDNGPDDPLKTAQSWLIGIGIGVLILAAMVVAYEIGTNNADQETVATPAAEEPSPQPAAQGPESELFVANCGSCHTLASAGTTGTTGPNLDDLAPDAQMVESAIKIGGTGSGAMPPGLLSGKQATAVSEYVATAAGSGG